MSDAGSVVQAKPVAAVPPRWAEKALPGHNKHHKTKFKPKPPATSKTQTSKEKGALPQHLPPRAKSTNSKPSKPQTRTLKSNVTGLHHTASDTSLTERVKNLSLRGGSASSRSSRLTPTRRGVNSYKTLEDLAYLIQDQRVKNIVVMCGAGISTSSGIPDFRSPGTGLYDNLKQYKIPYPESIFDIDYFEGNPKPFFTLAKELYPTGKYRPNYVHYFLRMLHEKGLLLRVYTQNIDGLERLAGVPTQKLVEAHGTFFTASCVRCSESYQADLVRKIIINEKIPRCHKNRCLGLIKPDIVFFGENLPKRFYYYLKDFPQADLLLVMGTSLEVDPFASIVDSVRLYIPRVLFNRNAVGPFKKKSRTHDFTLKGDLVEQVEKLTALLGWTDDLETILKEKEENAQNLQLDGSPLLDEESLTSANILVHPSSHTRTVQQRTGKPPAANPRPSDSAISVKQIHTLYNNIVTRPKSNAELISVRNIAKSPLGGDSSSSNSHRTMGSNNKTKPPSGPKSTLPKLFGKTFPAFHAQSKLYRCGNDKGSDSFFPGPGRTLPKQQDSDSDSDEDDDSDDSESSDDE